MCYRPTVAAPIPFHRPSITQAEVDAVSAVLRSGWLTTGPKARELEAAVVEYVAGPAGGKTADAAGAGAGSAGRAGAGARAPDTPLHAVAVSSCTAALHLSLIAAGVGEGDEVVTSPYTFVSTGETILYLDARPVFVDVEPSTRNPDPEQLARAITPRTRAIVTVSIAGHPCRASEIGAIARDREIPVIEDAAHSLTARIGETPVGTQADITCFSFYATKGVTSGEGGMAVTARAEWAERIRRLCLHGLSDAAWSRYDKGGWWEYDVTELGYKYNLTDIQAGLALAQLSRAEAMRARREAIARRYTEGLHGIAGLSTPAVSPGVRHAWHLYQIAVGTEAKMDRTALALALRADGIGTSVHFKPLHLLTWYQKLLGLRAGRYPNAERCYAESLSLPIYPDLTDADVDRVVDRIRSRLT
jgi:dTDP-4-amino-4,6-dideoxygalactose transaminase